MHIIRHSRIIQTWLTRVRHTHSMDTLRKTFQWILPLNMKPISFQSKASVVCSVPTAIFIDFCLKKLNVFSQHIGQKTNEYLNSAEQITRNWNDNLVSALITSWNSTQWCSINLLCKELMQRMGEHTCLISSNEILITTAWLAEWHSGRVSAVACQRCREGNPGSLPGLASGR